MYKRFEKIYFVGIGGVGMSGIAEVLKNLGYDVAGSDLRESEITKRLEDIGITINIGHHAENVKDAHVVVISSAVSSDNPEVRAAKEMSIPVIPRAEMLAEIARLKYSILVAGAHGKTTTTSLIASVIGEGGFDPTVVIGGKLKGIASNARLGSGDFLVAEADESDGSFLKLSPTIAVVTNIDKEHIDYFKDIDHIKDAFLSFVNKVPFYGLCILYGDNEHVKELIPKIERRYITYGLDEKNDFSVRDIKMSGLTSSFNVVVNNRDIGRFEIPLIGKHNICNALACIAVASELGMKTDDIKKALTGFSGVQRRFELKGTISGIRVIDDYGHHPAEINATLRAAKEAILNNGSSGRLIVLFQPHRYTRTRDLLGDFCEAFTDADRVVLMDIYPAGEKPLPGINAGLLFERIKGKSKDIEYISNREEILDYLNNNLQASDTLLTLGAGDVWKVGEEFLKMKSREKGN